MAVDVITETTISKPIDVVAAVRMRPVERADLVREHQIGRVKDPATVAGRVAGGVRRPLPRTEAGLHLRGNRTGAQFPARHADREGPFPMQTIYIFEAIEGSTRMTLRNRGEPGGFSKLVAPMMTSAMRRANRKDLARLRRLLEAM